MVEKSARSALKAHVRWKHPRPLFCWGQQAKGRSRAEWGGGGGGAAVVMGCGGRAWCAWHHWLRTERQDRGCTYGCTWWRTSLNNMKHPQRSQLNLHNKSHQHVRLVERRRALLTSETFKNSLHCSCRSSKIINILLQKTRKFESV